MGGLFDFQLSKYSTPTLSCTSFNPYIYLLAKLRKDNTFWTGVWFRIHFYNPCGVDKYLVISCFEICLFYFIRWNLSETFMKVSESILLIALLRVTMKLCSCSSFTWMTLGNMNKIYMKLVWNTWPMWNVYGTYAQNVKTLTKFCNAKYFNFHVIYS